MPCCYHTSTPVGRGELLLIGGLELDNDGFICHTRLLDGNNGLKAVVIEGVQYARVGHTATRVGTQQILLFGGSDE